MNNHLTIIFDFDGTIADTFHKIISISNRLAKELNFKTILPEEINDLKNKSAVEIIKHLDIPLLKVPKLASKAKKELHKEIESIHLIEGFHEMIMELKKKGNNLGILTSNSSNNVHKFLKTHKLDCFDFVTSSHRIWTKYKGLHKLIKEFKLDFKKVIYVGDETRDIEAAQKAGIQSIAVTWGYNSPKALKKCRPDYTVNHPQEILEIVKKLTKS
ncbi:Phosphoglycolate phosphatase [hydrothermal vent metagenome]|uniref:Phosphoglycolate phosphatase n=1 Tax=hydrothermal vent metagenome TaxID=652676 RepID=A0A3B0U4E2_9ZZZZ